VSHETSSSLGDLAPGARLAGYEVQEKVGSGGMAAVYRALDLGLGRLVALKVLAPDLAGDDIFRQRFIRESRAAARVEHPHIVPVFDAGEADGLLFIAMRYTERGDLRRLLEEEGTLAPVRAASITAQVASALDAAHAYGLVHRDVKPGNILLGDTNGSEADYVYLSDFGLSKHSLNGSTLTATGQFFGTLDYVAPEQIQGQQVDGRADQYALACTVVEMLAGAPPFKRDKTVELMWAQLEAPPPWLSERRPDLPLAVDAVIRTALAKSPRDRFATCGEFAVALRSACEGKPAPTAPASPRLERTPARATPWQAPSTRKDAIFEGTAVPKARHTAPLPSRRGGRHRRSAAVIAVVALIGLAGLAAVGYTLFGHRHAPPVAGRTGRIAHQATPAATVRAYFGAINRRDYFRAWQLRGAPGDTQDFRQFEDGFSGTADDKIHILSVQGDVVTATLVAEQSDGGVKVYRGTYTVDNGVIVDTDVQPVS
jgi:serine/threonine protein kinase